MNFEKLTGEELVEEFLEEYKNSNLIVKRLLNRLFSTIENEMKTIGPNDTILEVGCGPGASSLRIMKTLKPGQKFEVSEYEEKFVNVLKLRGFPIPIKNESVYCMDRPDKSVDWILLLEVLEHLDNYEQALSEIRRVARKGLIVSVPNEPLWRILNFLRLKYVTRFGNTPGHINHWSPNSLKKLLSKYGKVINLKQPLPWTVSTVRFDG